MLAKPVLIGFRGVEGRVRARLELNLPLVGFCFCFWRVYTGCLILGGCEYCWGSITTKRGSCIVRIHALTPYLGTEMQAINSPMWVIFIDIGARCRYYL